MKLSEIISDLPILSAKSTVDPEIEGISEDSRNVGKNYLFFARKGAKTSGLNYAKEAIAKGACAVLSDEAIEGLPGDVPVIRVKSISDAESKISNRFYGNPSKDLTLVGVTGTNGKTTFTYLLEAIAREMGWRVGVIGTISYKLPRKGSDEMEILPAPNTTPNALELQKLLHTLRDRKTDLVVMEVSSHALALGRVDSLEFDGGVFTNLTQDHLDFHGDMENYYLAKERLFRDLSPARKPADSFRVAPGKPSNSKFSIINFDDPVAKRLVSVSRVPVTGYGIHADCDFAAQDIELLPSGCKFNIRHKGTLHPLQMHLVGQHNVYNALASAAAAFNLGVPMTAILRGLEKIQSVPGRLEPIHCGQDFAALVDYAHTEDALENVLESLQSFKKKRIITVFGCGGDRDRSKRPLMGACAVHLSDWVVVTSDNPRSEDPQKIALDIEVGIHRTGKNNYEVILDREKAIEKALQMAKKDDVVLIAGKGHETYQIFSNETIHFDDREVVRRILCTR